MESYLKFFIKSRIVGPLRAIFLFFGGAPVNHAGWEKRLLIINLEALGDLIVFTSVLKHYKRRFPNFKIHLLVKAGTGAEVLLGDFVDEIITVEYRRFAGDPWYGSRFINRLRRIGFEKIINHDFSAAEILGKYIALSCGAKEVIGYAGMGLEFRRPFDLQQKKNLRIVTERLHPRFTTIIRRIDIGCGVDHGIPSALNHYVAIYEGVTGFEENDYATSIPGPSVKETQETLGKFDLAGVRYAVVNVGASVAYKRWPVKHYKAVIRLLEERGIMAVLVGSRRERLLGEELMRLTPGVLDAIGKTTLRELITLIAHSVVTITNDTSTVHFAVALQKPSLSMIGGGQFGMFSNYGYLSINRWVYNETKCFGDNWYCGRRVRVGEPSPCVSAITVESVEKALHDLLNRITDGGRSVEAFVRGASVPLASFPRHSKNVKVLFSGVEFENYNPLRSSTFEHSNFYATLKSMKGVDVIEYPFDPIIGMGKRAWNRELLELVERERPDAFFAFMLSDEFEIKTLEKIKKLATSIAWFADDHWRLDNYSRFYAPHFSWIVTTWSEAPARYASYGVKNVIRSQWACNERAWKPADVKQDIEVSFVGQANPSRREIVAGLRAGGIKVWVRGFGWPEGRATNEEMISAFSRSRINLNFNTPVSRFALPSLGRLFFARKRDGIGFDLRHPIANVKSWWNMSIPQIKARPFEILGCKAFLISGFADDMDAYYTDGKEIVYYDGTIGDLILKIKAYANRDEDRHRIAEAGYARTLREHTYAARFKEIFRKAGIRTP